MLGYPQGTKGYRLLDLSTNQIFVSRDVVFYENSFPFHTSHYFIPNTQTVASLVLPHPIIDIPTVISPISYDIDSTTSSPLSAHSPPSLPDSPSHSPLDIAHQSHAFTVTNPILNTSESILDNIALPSPPTIPLLRKSTRMHKIPTYLQEFHCNNAFLPTTSQSPPTTAQGTLSTAFPILDFISYSNLAPSYHSFVLNASSI
jgi:hypothetical protein